MGRGSVFLKENDVVIDARELKELERKAASVSDVELLTDVVELQARLEEFRLANVGLAQQNEELHAQVAQLSPPQPTG